MKDGEALLFLLPCPLSPSNFQQVAFLDKLHLEDSVALDFCIKCMVVAVVFYHVAGFLLAPHLEE